MLTQKLETKRRLVEIANAIRKKFKETREERIVKEKTFARTFEPIVIPLKTILGIAGIKQEIEHTCT